MLYEYLLSTCVRHFKYITYIAHFNLKILQKLQHFTSKTILIVAEKMCTNI